MMSAKLASALGIGVLLVGLLTGYLLWGRPKAELRARAVEETKHSAELESRLAGAESEIKRLTQELELAKRDRQRLEEIVSEGRK